MRYIKLSYIIEVSKQKRKHKRVAIKILTQMG
jgi:hypothetical protein